MGDVHPERHSRKDRARAQNESPASGERSLDAGKSGGAGDSELTHPDVIGGSPRLVDP
jgi:hypothetical protein